MADDEKTRRQNDRDLGFFMGRMDTFCQNQEVINQKLFENIEKLDIKFDVEQKAQDILNHADKTAQNAEIESLKGSRKGLVGLLIGSSMGGGSMTAALMKYLGVH